MSNMMEKNLKNIDQKIPLESNKAKIQQENLLIELNGNSKNRNRIKGGNGISKRMKKDVGGKNKFYLIKRRVNFFYFF